MTDPDRQVRRGLALVLGASAVGVAASPVVLALAAAFDLVTGPRRRRALRAIAMAYTYAVNELIGAAVCAALWVGTAGGRIAPRWYVERHHVLQRRWAARLAWGMRTFTGFEVVTQGVDSAAHGPVIICGRHVSFGDAILPLVLLAGPYRLHMRYVLKRELLSDPAFGVLGRRIPNHFVDRGPSGAASRTAIRDLVAGMGPRDASVIFPEGTFYTPRRHEISVRRLQRRTPELAARAARLRHLLPPQPQGLQAMLDGAPDADLVLYAHIGFERFPTLLAIWANLPFREPVRVRFERFARADIPAGDDLLPWLFDRWVEMDEWIDAAGSADETRREAS